jgi:hypothetical protein
MQIRTLFALSASAALLIALGTGCAETSDDTNGPLGPRTSGLALTSDTLGDTDVGGMRFTVTGCAGTATAGYSETVNKDLEDLYLPGGISTFEDAPYDADSQHLFSDHYFLLAAGCYDVVTQPLKANGQLSQDCFSAHRDNVTVEDGKTREILLINQCLGPANGGLDVIGTINHPPEIRDVEFKDSKFLSSCTGRNEVCVTVFDPDNDPIEIQWGTSQNFNYLGNIRPATQSPAQTVNNDGSITYCGEVVTGPRGDYGYTLTAWDLATNSLGQIDRIEDILTQQGDPNLSRDDIEFPIYAGMDCRGRSSVVLMAMNNNPGPDNSGFAVPFIRQLGEWVNPYTLAVTPKVLHVLDDNGQNEHPGDDTFVINALRQSFGVANVDGISEPGSGLSMADVQGYDIVWFANPGFPMDDPASYDTLQSYLNMGGGLVIQGDDMAGPALQGGRDLDWFSFLTYQDNGITTCGDTTNNNVGNNHTVTFTNEPISALNGSQMDLRGQSFQYGNDIDHTLRQFGGERVLAEAVYTSGQCTEQYPAAVAIDPVDLP